MRENDNVLLSFFVGIGLLIGAQIVLIAAPGQQLAWIGTIGSVAAVLIALSLASRQARNDAMIRRLQARSLGLALHPEVREIRLRADAVRTKLHHAPGPIARMSETEVQMLEVPLPNVLGTSIKNLFVFGEPLGAQLQSLVAELGAYRRTLADFKMRAQHDAARAVDSGELLAHLKQAAQLAKLIEAGLAELTK